MFREDIGSTFSDIWYRVAGTRPRLSPHAQIVRQQYGPAIAYIVEDPAGGQFYRMTEAAYFFVGLLDGRRTVDEAWNACNAQLGDDAPTQRECLEVLGKLQLFGLMLGDLPLAADMVLERKAQVRALRIKRRTGNWMFPNIPLVNPEPFLERYKHVAGAIFSRWGALAWIAVVSVALVLVAKNWHAIGSPLNDLLRFDPRSVALLAGLFLGLRALHELGHAAACKAMGGRSTEIGVILIAGVLPLPYCDATTAWRFPETWKRVLVSSAGVLAETFVAAIGAIVWAVADDAAWRSLGFTTMVVSGFTTILFNINPLLRYDGYYILSDLTGTPNLAQRSREIWMFFAERYVFRLPFARPPRVRDAAEARLLTVFGALSWPYRIFIGVVIALVVSQMYLTLGVVIAVIAGSIWLVWPFVKGLSYLAGSPRLAGRRARSVGIVAAAVAVVGLVVGAVPVPAAGYAAGTVEPWRLGALRAEENGFVVRVLRRAGERVEAGEAVVELENIELAAAEVRAAADLAVAHVSLDGAMTRSQAEVDKARAEIAALETRLARIREQLAALTVRAPVSGRLSPAPGARGDLSDLEGRFLTRGGLIALVVSTDDLVVRSVVSDKEHAYLFRGAGEGPRPTVRVRGRAGREVPASVARVAPAGSRELPNSALAMSSGGDIAIDPTARERVRALNPGFVVDVRPGEALEGAQPGLRARVRFGVSPEPLLWQLVRRGRQFFSERTAS